MLRYAYLHDCKSGPVLLVWGEALAMAHLHEALVGLAEGEGPALLNDVQGCQSADGSTVLLETVGEAEGLVRDEVEPDVFHWRVDREGWFDFMAQVGQLTHCSPTRPSHKILRCHADDDIAVMVSCGELPEVLKLTP